MGKTLRKVWLLIGVPALLASCHPSDFPVRSIRERLESGEIIEYTEPGAIREICNKNGSEWHSIQVPQEQREGVVLGKYVSILGAGKYVCYRVGATVQLIQGREQNFQAGQAVVRRVALVRADRLEKFHLKGKAWASDETFQREKDFLRQKRLKPKDQGIAHIVDLVYVPGSAADEKTLTDQESSSEPAEAQK